MVDGLVSKDKKAKKVKDPNAPKRPKNNFMLFLQDHRATVKASNPDVKQSSKITSLAGDIWRGLSETEKAPYNERAAEEKIRYAEEKAAYDLSKVNPEFEADLAHAQEIAILVAAEKKAVAKAEKAEKAKAAKVAKAEKAKAAKAAKAEKAKAAKAEKAKAAKAAKAKALKEQLAALEASQDESQVDEEVQSSMILRATAMMSWMRNGESEVLQFEFPTGSGKYYLRSNGWYGNFEDDESPAIGHWDEDDQVIVMDDE